MSIRKLFPPRIFQWERERARPHATGTFAGHFVPVRAGQSQQIPRLQSLAAVPTSKQKSAEDPGFGPEDAGDESLGFNVRETTRTYDEFVIAMSFCNAQRGVFYITHRQAQTLT
jgi:hypothetical protein